jgi:hypothetical protein
MGGGHGVAPDLGAPGSHPVAPEIWERGKSEEVPNTDQSVQWILMEQRLSMVKEIYYRNVGRKRGGGGAREKESKGERREEDIEKRKRREDKEKGERGKGDKKVSSKRIRV